MRRAALVLACLVAACLLQTTQGQTTIAEIVDGTPPPPPPPASTTGAFVQASGPGSVATPGVITSVGSESGAHACLHMAGSAACCVDNVGAMAAPQGCMGPTSQHVAGTTTLQLLMQLTGYGILPWPANGSAVVQAALQDTVQPSREHPMV